MQREGRHPEDRYNFLVCSTLELELPRFGGHSSIETTASYDRGDLEEALRAAEKLYYPSMRRRVSLPIQN